MHSSLFTCSAWKIGVCEFRGSATGFLIAVEPKTRKALPVPRIAAVNHRLYMPVTSNCAPPRHVNCWQHSSEQPARIIHIFTGSQINSPRSNPEARILKLWQPETSIFIFSCPKQLYRFGGNRSFSIKFQTRALCERGRRATPPWRRKPMTSYSKWELFWIVWWSNKLLMHLLIISGQG